MTSSRPTTRDAHAATQPSETSSTLAHPLAPEDIRSGDFVTPLSVVVEMPSYYWCADAWDLPRDELVRIRLTSASDGVPLKVKSVCLPFVLARHPQGETRTFDLRRCQLARLDRAYATSTWKAFKRAKPKRPIC